MTFILNLLHSDFSLIASDTKATTKGTTTLTAPGITIQLNEGSTISGLQKIYFAKRSDTAIGFAGHTDDHYYMKEVQASDNGVSACSVIRKHMEHFLLQDHKAVVTSDHDMANSGIVTYYDNETGRFFSTFYSFSRVHSYAHLYPGGDTLRLIHAGSGSDVFESSVGLEEINHFCASCKHPFDINTYLEWMRQAYIKVSSFDNGTGQEMSAFQATVQDTIFVDAHS